MWRLRLWSMVLQILRNRSSIRKDKYMKTWIMVSLKIKQLSLEAIFIKRQQDHTKKTQKTNTKTATGAKPRRFQYMCVRYTSLSHTTQQNIITMQWYHKLIWMQTFKTSRRVNQKLVILLINTSDKNVHSYSCFVTSKLFPIYIKSVRY